MANYLPSEIARGIDLGSLEYVKGSFVSPEFKEYFSDLLCKITFSDKQWGYLYLLWEHKSAPEPLITFQLLKYMVRIWELWQKNEKKEAKLKGFPLIIPFIFYHGAEQWQVKESYRDLFNYPERLLCFVPDFRYLLWDASCYSDEEIKGAVWLQVVLLTMKYIERKDLRERLPEIFSLMTELLRQPSGPEQLKLLFRYIITAGKRQYINMDDIRQAVAQSLPKGGKIMETVADVLIEQGRQQGIKHGLEKGLEQGILLDAREAVLDNLEVHFGTIPVAIREIIDNINDAAVLKQLRREVFKSSSLEEFHNLLKEKLQ